MIRRSLLIDPKFQLGVVLYFNGLVTFVLGALYLLLPQFLQKIELAARNAGLPIDHPVLLQLQTERSALAVFFLLFFLATSISATLVALIMSHRIVGPLYRLKEHWLRVAEGKTLDDVVFREDDFFHEVADACNRHMAQLRGEGGGALRIVPAVEPNGSKEERGR